jgi:uncharacterized membrane protein
VQRALPAAKGVGIPAAVVRAVLSRRARDGTVGRSIEGGASAMPEIGPVQMLVVAFGPDANLEGRIVDELAKLESERTIRILDLLFVHKDADTGELLALDHQGESLGAIVGALLGFEGEGVEQRLQDEGAGDRAFGLTGSEIEDLARSLEPGTSAGFLLVEHVWARDLKRAIRDAGGVPVREGFLTPETVRAVEPELAAVAERLGHGPGAPAAPG